MGPDIFFVPIYVTSVSFILFVTVQRDTINRSYTLRGCKDRIIRIHKALFSNFLLNYLSYVIDNMIDGRLHIFFVHRYALSFF